VTVATVTVAVETIDSGVVDEGSTALDVVAVSRAVEDIEVSFIVDVERPSASITAAAMFPIVPSLL